MPETRVRGSRSAGGHANPGAARGAGVTFRREDAALLVPGQDRADFGGFRERLMDGHRRAAGIGEDRVHALAFETGDEDFRAVHDRPAIR